MSGRAPRVLFAPAAGPEIGGGHVMRGLALAEALQARGAEVAFAVPPWGERLIARLAAQSVRVHPLARSGDAAAISAALEAVRPDALVLDDYALDARATEILARPGLTRVVIDDLAERAHACDLLVDPGYARSAADYAGRVPEHATVLAGPRYALLRSGFGRVAPARPPRRAVERIFVSFGLSDVGAIAARAVERLRPRAPYARFDVALASDAASLPRLRVLAERDEGLVLHPDAREVATLMQAADMAVGAGGSATWERCALGLPTLAVVVADNQRSTIAGLADAGVLLAVDAAARGFEIALEAAFDRLADPGLRARLQSASRAVCDGQGAARVAEALLALCARGD